MAWSVCPVWLRARSAREGGLTPAVALTAYVRDEDVAAALAAGYQRHMRKPVVVSDLIAKVKRRRPDDGKTHALVEAHRPRRLLPHL